MSNILFILPFFTLGGAETQAFNVAIFLKKKGYTVSFLAFEKKNGKLLNKLEENYIDWKLSSYNLNAIHQSGVKKFVDLIFESGLNPRGELDFSPHYLFSKGIFKWQVKSQL